jgi:iron complex outermembrane recepter protein
MTAHRSGLALLAAAWLAGNLAGAQEPRDSAAASSGQLEEVIVTAQKREQTLADVPISVTVLGNDALTKLNVVSMQGLEDLVPDLHVAITPYQPILYIRGVGSGGGDRTFDQSVSTYVDGVYQGNANQLVDPFFDIDRIEVARGPQGVLFGVNAVAGGVNIVSREPGSELGGFVSGGYELYDHSYHYDAAVDLPLAGGLSMRIAGTKGNQGPYLHNVVASGPHLETDYDLIRDTLKWQPTADLAIKVTAQSSRNDTEGSPFEMYALGTRTLPVYGYAIPPIENGVLDFDKSSATPAEHTYINSRDFTLNADWRFGGGFALSDTIGYSAYDFSQAVPPAAIPIDLGTNQASQQFNQLYEELRLTSPAGRRVDYTLGAVYFRQNQYLYQGIDLVVPGGPVGIRHGFVQATKTAATFAQLTFHLSSRLRVVAGARYSDVRKDVSHDLGASASGAPLIGFAFDPAAAVAIATFPPLGWLQYLDPAAPAPQLKRASLLLRKVDPSASIQADLSAHVHPYLTLSQATKAGGFDDQDLSGVTPFAYRPESARSIELGVKVNLPSLQVNADVFRTRFDDLQETVAVGNTVQATNAASATSQGLELDALVQATERIRIGANFTYVHAYYNDFPGVGCITPLDAIVAATAPCSLSGVSSPAQTNAAGEQLEFSPRYTAAAHVDGTHPLPGSMILVWGARLAYSDGYRLQAIEDPLDVQSAYTLIDAYLGVQGAIGSTPDRSWEVTLQGTNLGDRAVLAFGGPAGLGAGHQGDVQIGRQIYLTLKLSF